MTGDKRKLINHFRSLSLDLTHFPTDDHLLGVCDIGVFLTQASTQMKKVTIRAPIALDIQEFIDFMDRGVDEWVVSREYIEYDGGSAGSQSMRYVTWEAKRLVWKVRPVKNQVAT